MLTIQHPEWYAIRTRSRFEKAHQMAAAHKVVMEQIGQASYELNASAQAKRLNAAARCMAVYQQGLLALHKVRQNGHQRIMVQYVNVSNGTQAVIENIERDSGGSPQSESTIPLRRRTKTNSAAQDTLIGLET